MQWVSNGDPSGEDSYVVKTLVRSWGDSCSLLSYLTLCMSLDGSMLPFPSIKEKKAFIFFPHFFFFFLEYLEGKGLYKAKHNRAPG